MNLKLKVLFPFIIIVNSVLGKLPILNTEPLNIAYPVFLNLPQPSNQNSDYYRFDNVSSNWVKDYLRYPLAKDVSSISNLGFDPIKFNIKASQDSIVIGQEIEFTITATFQDINQMIMFQFEGINKYQLKVIFPDNFIQTDGVDYKNIKDELNINKKEISYKVKGYFTKSTDNYEIKLIRGDFNATDSDLYILKKKLILPKSERQDQKKQLPKIQKADDKLAIIQKKKFRNLNSNCISIYIIGTREYCPGTSTSASASYYCASNISWQKNGNYFSSSSSISINSPGYYTLSCTDVCGGTQTVGDNFYQSPNVATQVSINTVYQQCQGQYSDLYASNCNGSYSWSNGSTSNMIQVQPGTYSVTCTQSCNSTSASGSVIGTSNTTPSKPSISAGTTELCQNSTTNLSVSSCDNSGWLEWSNEPANINAVGAGTYGVACRNSCGRSEYAWVVIGYYNNSPPSPYISGPVSVCPGSNVTINSSGCPAGSTFSWTNGSNGVVSYNQAASSGGYTLYGFCKDNCSGSISYSNGITVYPASVGSTPYIYANNYNVCSGNKVNIYASGCDGQTVYWYVNGYGSSIATGNSIEVGSGSYYSKCEGSCGQGEPSNSVTINSLGSTPSQVNLSSTYQEICDNNTVNVSVSDCNAYVSWSDGYGGVSNRTLSPNENEYTSYTVYCSNDCGSTSKSITIKRKGYSPTTPTISASSLLACSGNVTLTASGCNGSVIWNDNGALTGSSLSVGVGTYTAKCQTVCGTSAASNSLTITNLANSVATVNINYPNGNACGATSVGLVANVVEDINGTLLTYGWTGPNSFSASGKTVTAYQSGTYTITVSGGGKCPGYKTAVVDLKPIPPAPAIVASPNPACVGETVTIGASNCTGTLSFSNGMTSTYTMGATSVGFTANCSLNGCVSQASSIYNITLVPVQGKPNITASDTKICDPSGSVTLNSNCNAGNTPMWSNGATTPTITVSSTSSYTVKCRNRCGVDSPNSDQINIVKDPSIAPTISASKTEICQSETATLTASGCASGVITWSNGQTGSSISVGAGNYTAACKTPSCPASIASNTITINNVAAPSPFTINSTLPILCSSTAVATLTAPNCNATLIWWDGTISPSKNVSTPGTYTAKCRNSCNVETTASRTLNQDIANPPTLTANRTDICAALTATLTATGCNTGTVKWSTGATGTSITVNTAGAYTAICTTTCGDSGPSSVITITKDAIPAAPTMAATKPTVCSGVGNDINTQLTITGCTGKIAWYIMNGNGTQLNTFTTANTSATQTVTASTFIGYNTTVLQYKAACLNACENLQSTNSNVVSLTLENITANASSNSPPSTPIKEFEGTLSLQSAPSGTEYTYVWTGPNSFTSNLQNPTIPTESLHIGYSGTYTVTLSTARGCISSATTSVNILPNALVCENYSLKIINPATNLETDILNRLPNSVNFESVNLNVLNVQASDLFGVNFKWIGPKNYNSLTKNTSINFPGTYYLEVTRGSSSCFLEAKIKGQPCLNLTGDTFVCLNAFDFPTSQTTNELENLKVGDTFLAADYLFTVKEVKGSTGGGWSGKAVGTLRVINGISINVLPVEFSNIALNECNQYIGTTTVSTLDQFSGIRTEYDPKWKNIVDATQLIKNGKELLDEIQKEFGKGKAIFETGSDEEILKYIEENRSNCTAQVAAIQALKEIPEEEKAEWIAIVQSICSSYNDFYVCKTNTSSLLNIPNGSNARISTNNESNTSADCDLNKENVKNQIDLKNQALNAAKKGKSLFFAPDWTPFKKNASVTFLSPNNPKGTVKGFQLNVGGTEMEFIFSTSTKKFQNAKGEDINVYSKDLIEYVPSIAGYAWAMLLEENPCPLNSKINYIAIENLDSWKSNPVFTDPRVKYSTDVENLDCGSIRNLTSTPFDITELKKLLNGEKPTSDNRRSTKVILYISDATTSAALINAAQKHVDATAGSSSEIVIWIHKNGSTWEFKGGGQYLINKFNTTYSTVTLNGQPVTFARLFSEFQGSTLDNISTGIYTFFDQVSNAINKVKIPESVWNCDDPDIYDDTYVTVYKYLTAPVQFLKEGLCSNLVTIVNQNFASANLNIDCGASAKWELAAMCGLWDGLIDMFSSLPAMISTVSGISSTTAWNNWGEMYESLKNYKRYPEGINVKNPPPGVKPEAQGVMAAIMDGFASEFNPRTPCVLSHNLGMIVTPIVISIVATPAAGALAGGSTINVAQRTIRSFAKIVKRIDDLASLPTDFIGKWAGKSVFKVVDAIGSKFEINAKIGKLNAKLRDYNSTGAAVDKDLELDEVISVVKEGCPSGFINIGGGDNVYQNIIPSYYLAGCKIVITTKDKNNVEKKYEIDGNLSDWLDSFLKAKLTGADLPLISKFKRIYLADQSFRELFENASPTEREELLQGWKAISGYSENGFAKDILKIQAATNIIKKGKISSDDLKKIIDTNQAIKQAGSALDDFLLDLDYFSDYFNSTGFSRIISSLKISSASSADGANWVIELLRKEAGSGEFPKTNITSFEITESFSGKTRRYDITVGNSPNKKYYELKSWKNVPPDYFSEQFINDLRNPSINDISNLKWVFDRTKYLSVEGNTEVNFKKYMEDAVKKLEIPSDFPFPKFGVNSGEILKEKLLIEFNNIFELK